MNYIRNCSLHINKEAFVRALSQRRMVFRLKHIWKLSEFGQSYQIAYQGVAFLEAQDLLFKSSNPNKLIFSKLDKSHQMCHRIISQFRRHIYTLTETLTSSLKITGSTGTSISQNLIWPKGTEGLWIFSNIHKWSRPECFRQFIYSSRPVYVTQ